MRRGFLLLLVTLLLMPLSGRGDAAPVRSENVLLITFDGLRWQEVFRGVDPELFNRTNIAHYDDARKMFWRENVEERRTALLPFLWNVVAKEGQILGNTNRGSVVRVTNGKNFSYPGYQELLAGFPDARINSNNAGPNPNVTVLEWLNQKPRYRNRVAAFCSWNAFHDIINTSRSGVFVTAGTEPVTYRGMGERQELLNQMTASILPPWDTVRWDFLTFHTALEYVRQRQPRVIYIAFDETDDWAHDGNYERYLRAAHQADNFIRQFWETLQKQRQYRGKTSLFITTDHGRGNAPSGWKSHGDVKGSEYIWIAALGPDTPALGERSNHEPLTQAHVASSVAALLGEDYPAAQPKAAAPVPGVLR